MATTVVDGKTQPGPLTVATGPGGPTDRAPPAGSIETPRPFDLSDLDPSCGKLLECGLDMVIHTKGADPMYSGWATMVASVKKSAERPGPRRRKPKARFTGGVSDPRAGTRDRSGAGLRGRTRRKVHWRRLRNNPCKYQLRKIREMVREAPDKYAASCGGKLEVKRPPNSVLPRSESELCNQVYRCCVLANWRTREYKPCAHLEQGIVETGRPICLFMWYQYARMARTYRQYPGMWPAVCPRPL